MRKGWKRVHRLVVLPDYQGIGIGLKFINEVCRHYYVNGWNVNLTTTTPALIHALCKNKNWLLFRKSRIGNSLSSYEKYYGEQHKNNKGHGVNHLNNNASKNRLTFSFNFKEVITCQQVDQS